MLNLTFFSGANFVSGAFNTGVELQPFYQVKFHTGVELNSFIGTNFYFRR